MNWCVFIISLFGIYFVHQSPERKSYLCKYWRLTPTRPMRVTNLHPPHSCSGAVCQSVIHLCYVALINLCTLRRNHPFALTLSYMDCGKPSRVCWWLGLCVLKEKYVRFYCVQSNSSCSVLPELHKLLKDLRTWISWGPLFFLNRGWIHRHDMCLITGVNNFDPCNVFHFVC